MPNIIKDAVAVIALTVTASAGSAQEVAWGTGYQMGTSYAGVSNAQKARLSFYCGDSAAAKANPAIRGGPYLTVSLPKAPALETARSVEVVLDGKATAIPVEPKSDIDSVELNWKPSPAFGLAQMKPVIAGLRKAKAIEVRAAGQSASLPSKGADKALADDPLGCT